MFRKFLASVLGFGLSRRIVRQEKMYKPSLFLLEDRLAPATFADVSLQVLTAPSSQQGGRVVYEALVGDNGPGTAAGTYVVLHKPQGLVLNAALSPRVSNSGDYVIANVGTILPGRLGTARFVFDVSPSAPLGSQTVEAWTGTNSSFDLNQSNNYGSTTTSITQGTADLSVVITAPPSRLRPQTLPVVVTLKNNGPLTANNSVVTIPVPANLGVAAGTGYTVSGGVVTVSGGNLLPGKSVTRSITFTTTAVGTDTVEQFTATASTSTFETNFANNVGLAGTLVTVPYTPRMAVSVLSTGTSTIAVANQKNVLGMRFVVDASSTVGTPKDLFLTRVDVAAASGNLLNAQNFRLKVDTDGNGVTDTFLQSGVNASGGHVLFASLAGGGYVIPATGLTTFEVYYDVAASLSAPPQLQLRLVGVSGKRMDTGAALTASQIVVTSSPSIVNNFIKAGSLTVTMAPIPIRQRQLIAGVQEDIIFALRFHAEGEDIAVTTLRLVTVGGLGQSISSLDLFNPGELSPFASLTLAGNGSDLVYTSYAGQSANTLTARMENNQLVIHAGLDRTVYVRPRLKTQDDGAVLGEGIQLALVGSPFTGGANGLYSVAARGLASSNNLQPNDGTHSSQIVIGQNSLNSDLIGVRHIVVGNKIVEINNVDPTPSGSFLFTGPGVLAEHEVVVSSNTNAKFGINKNAIDVWSYDITLTNAIADAGSFYVYNKADVSQKALAQVYQNGILVSSGSVTGSFQVVVDFRTSSVNTVLDSGSRARFVLEANVTNPKVSASQATFARATLNVSPGNILIRDFDAVFSQSLNWLDLPDTFYPGNVYVS
jgi:hypothetical protein